MIPGVFRRRLLRQLVLSLRIHWRHRLLRVVLLRLLLCCCCWYGGCGLHLN
jgi:hypothetical protein